MWVCVSCQKIARRTFEKCSGCGALETCAPAVPKRLRRLSSVEARPIPRYDVGIDWNRALGGGAPHGALVLIAGKGGNGKTTEMLRIAARLGTTEEPAIYAYSEREAEEIAAHAKLCDVDTTRITLLGPVLSIRDLLSEVPTGAHLFLDSIGNLEAFVPDDLDRLRNEIAPATAWLVCHVTKGGEIEGREKLGHKASAIVWVRRRSLRTVKNWHGPALTTPRELPAAFSGGGELHAPAPAPRKLAKLHAVHN